MPDPGPRFSFDPLERRGVLLGLQPAQLLTVSVAAVVAFGADVTMSRHGGRAAAALVLILGVVSAFWTRGGRPASAWLVEAASCFARRARGPVLDDQPLQGITPGSTGRRDAPGAATVRPVRTVSPRGIVLAALTSGPGSSTGVVVDRRHGRWVAAIPVKGRSFSLLDPEEQARRFDGWRVVLNSLGRPGTAVRRVQWIERSFPEVAAGLLRTAESLQPAAGSNNAVSSYQQLVARATPAQVHEAYVLAAVAGPPDVGSAQGRRAEEVLLREIRLLEGQLRNADLLPSPPLDLDELVAAIAAVYEPSTSRLCSFRSSPWPVAEDEQWSYVRSGSCWHATYWIADWPRVDVNPDFMIPLLVSEGRRTVSVVMEPVPPDRSAREVRSARTADAADDHLRSRAGFLPSARRGRESEGVVRREAELADGHAEFRFSGYVSVHAADRGSLDLACAEAEHASQAAHVEIRRLFGRQREALSWTLPLARGLR